MNEVKKAIRHDAVRALEALVRQLQDPKADVDSQALARLASAAERPGARCVVTGGTPSERRALLACYLAQPAFRQPAPFSFLHPGDGALRDRHPETLLHRLCHEARERLVQAEAVPAAREDLVEALPAWLARIASRGPAVILTTEVHLLIAEQLAPELDWLPDYLPEAVAWIATAAPSGATEALAARGWELIRLPPSPPSGRLPDTATPAVRDTAALLWAAPEGLSRDRLTESLGAPALAEALSALKPWLRQTDTGWCLRDETVRHAVGAAWLEDTASRRVAFARLAVTETDPIRAAWWFAEAADTEALAARLTDPNLLWRWHDFPVDRQLLWRRLPNRAATAQHLADRLCHGETDAAPTRAMATGLAIVDSIQDKKAGDRLLEEVLRHWPETRDPITAAALNSHRGRRALERDDPDTAVAFLTPALAILSQHRGSDHEDTRGARQTLAAARESQGDLATAETLYREALAAREAALGTEAVALVPHVLNLTAVVRARGDLAAARDLAQRALSLAERGHTRHHPLTATCLDALAGLLYSGHDYAAAEARYREAQALIEALFGPEHPATASGLHNLATTLDALERYPEAETLFRRALAIRQSALGDQHPDTASSVHNLAGVLDVLGRREEAETLYRGALAAWSALVGERHPATATSRNNLADLLRDSGRHAEAETLYQDNLATWRELYGDEHPNTLMTLAELAALYADAEHGTEAEILLRAVVPELERVMGVDNALHVDAVCRLATLLRRSGRSHEARVLLSEVYERARGAGHVLSPRLQKLRRHLELAQRGAERGP